MVIYILKQHSLEQPTFHAFMAGAQSPIRTIKSTSDKREARAWKEKSGLNFYEASILD